jgi:hypothetical protein
MNEFRAHQRSTRDEKPIYEAATFSVCRVPHFAETRYGIHFSDTDEAGLCTVFIDDNGKFYEGFYRADASFKSETPIVDLGLDEPV